MCNLFFICHVSYKWRHYLLHKIPKILIAENNIYMLTLILVIMNLQNWETRRKKAIHMIHRIMCSKNHIASALDTRCWNFTKSWRILNQSWWTRTKLSDWLLLLFFIFHSSESTNFGCKTILLHDDYWRRIKKKNWGRKIIRISTSEGRRRIMQRNFFSTFKLKSYSTFLCNCITNNDRVPFYL